MACIIKAPDREGKGKGILTLTTPERDQVILIDDDVRARLEALKDRWVIGLHHNWHDHEFNYLPLFDFSMAGEGDLIEAEGRTFEHIPLDACNFVPKAFGPSRSEKFWDVLFVARPVFFKGFDHLLTTVRNLYDSDHQYRVLCIAPVPPRRHDEGYAAGVRDSYEELFSDAEQDRFNLVTLDFRYPFPFDLPTLAHFYRSSRVFAHFAPEERRCRVAGYAWATGLPVVGMAGIGSLLPPELRAEPVFFQVDAPDKFAQQIIAAVDAATDGELDFDAPRRHVSGAHTHKALKRDLSIRFPQVGPNASEREYALAGLDIRLGRHHGLDAGNNVVASSVGELLDILATDEPAVRDAVAESDDPEMTLAQGIEPTALARARARLLRLLKR